MPNDDLQLRDAFRRLLRPLLSGEFVQGLPGGYEEMMFALWDEHLHGGKRVAHPSTLRAVVASAKSVMGKGGEGGDVVLFDGRRRELKIYIPVNSPLNYAAFRDKLREKSHQAGVYEVFMQVERPGCSTPAVKAAVNHYMRTLATSGDGAGLRHLDLIAIFDGNGHEIWRGKDLNLS